MSSVSLGWALLGTGSVSHSVASDLALVSGAKQVSVWSRTGENAQRFAGMHHFERSSSSLDEVLGDSEVDLVYIATPHATHAEFALAALRAGKHVLVEKPIGVNAAEAREIAAAAKTHDRFAMEAMWMRFNPTYRSLRADVTAGVIGQPQAVRATFGLPFGASDSERWSSERRSSTLLDQAIYAVTFARDVLGDPECILSRASVRGDDVDLTLHATLEYPGGRFAQLAASMVTYLEPSASVSGTNGWSTLAAPFWATDRYTTHSGDFATAFGAPDERVLPTEGNGYVPMLRGVQESILTGEREHRLHPLSESIAVMDILDQIRDSWPATTS
ncbi:Gfo/Idh/MocA family protein [Populibacterium corticicola]|uniref:Gfo/Idh/MocA family protein n=1 Tax=Populibacterium corticicola TaxID=1812826 RepID=A0ABW5XD23_9MICO